jgi:PKD repeat protein
MLTLLCATAAPCLRLDAGTVTFQGRAYSIETVTIAQTVTIVPASDLIFVQAPTGEKFLALPTSSQARGDFDPANQRFYLVDRSTGQVSSFNRINGTLIKLDGTLFDSMTQNPSAFDPPLETFLRPLTIPSTEVATDICIMSSTTLGYRTDGPALTDEHVYILTRQSASSVQQTINVTLRNGDVPNGNLNVFVERDEDTGNLLLVQSSLDPAANTETRDRITAIRPADGTVDSEIVLSNNTALPNYSGDPGGMAVDPTTGTIYLLDPAARQMYVFTPLRPTLTGISPPQGPAAGGTAITLSGLNLPPNAAVFFNGVAATDVRVAGDGASITCTNPAGPVGAVDVTVTGTGISPGAPLTVRFTYVNTLPIAHLTASPTQGLPPLAVLFSTTGSEDRDGTITQRIVDFGDGTTYTFPSDLTVVQVTHTYLAEGTFVALLKVRDNLGGEATDTQVVIVGEGADLVIRSLSFKASLVKDPALEPKDGMKLKGEIILPDQTDIADGELTVGLVHPDGALQDQSAQGYFTNTATGGQFCGYINDQQAVSNTIMKFAMKPVRKLTATPNTYTFSFTGQRVDLVPALEQAVVNLRYGEDGTEVTQVQKEETRVGKVLIIVRLRTFLGDSLQYRKLAVVKITGGVRPQMKLVRP